MADKKARKSLGRKTMRKTKGGNAVLATDPDTSAAKRQYKPITIVKDWTAGTP